MKELCLLTIGELSGPIRKKELSPLEVTKSVLERIDRLEKGLNAYITVRRDEALKAAQEAEKAILAGNYLGPLHGIPIALKDLFATKGVRTTGGSKIFADWIPPYDATVVEKLKNGGAIIIGKANLHEFAYGPTTINPHYGTTRNPWDRERISGGSSGGSAAAVAASLCSAALGSDTGGSIRLPAALCGIVGLKPTYGRASRFGVMPLSWSLDHAGPMTKSVEDAALVLNAIAGWDAKDPASSTAPVPDFTQALNAQVKGLKVGVLKEYLAEPMDAEVYEAVKKALATLESLGATVAEISVPRVKYDISISTTILFAEATAYHEPYLKTRPQDYGADVRARLQLGYFFLATHYLRAQRVRRLLNADFQAAFTKADVLITPTVPIAAPKIGEDTVELGGRVKDTRSALVRFTRLFNLIGGPAISVPCGFTAAGLPIGLQIVGRPWDEATVLRVAHAYEVHAGWRQRQPSMA